MEWRVLLFFFLILFIACNGNLPENGQNNAAELVSSSMDSLVNNRNLLADVPVRDTLDLIYAVIEIPSGTLEKWELDKNSGRPKLEYVNDMPRIIDYLPYPANYGMIPQTILPRNKGGDGDPLDVIVIGPPQQRGSVVPCKIVGVLKLLDRGEQDDKLIAIANNSSMFDTHNIQQLHNDYNGTTEIIELWFSNYKGPGQMVSLGYGGKYEAEKILELAIEEYAKSIDQNKPN